MSRASITGLQLVGFCEHRQSLAVLKKVSDRQAVGLHLQSNSRYITCSNFRSHAFGVVSDHALVSFLFQRTHKKNADKEKPIDEYLVDPSTYTGLIEKLRKRRPLATEGVREPDVYDSLRGFAHSFSNMRSPCGY